MDLFSGDALEEEECETRSRKAAVGLFGSFTAQLSNGINLSLSTYGPSGQPPTGKLFISIVAFVKILIN